MEDRIKVTGIAYNTSVAKITVQGVPDRPGLAAALFEPLAEASISVDTIVQNTGGPVSPEQAGFTDISFTVSRTDLPAAVRLVESVAPQMGAAGVVSAADLAAVSIVGSGMQNTPGYASRMFRLLANGGVNIDMITTSEIRISCIIEKPRDATPCVCFTKASSSTGSDERSMGDCALTLSPPSQPSPSRGKEL